MFRPIIVVLLYCNGARHTVHMGVSRMYVHNYTSTGVRSVMLTSDIFAPLPIIM